MESFTRQVKFSGHLTHGTTMLVSGLSFTFIFSVL